MSSDILARLQLDKDFDSRRVIVAKELNGCDSSFIISCVLSHCIKNKHATVLISTHNSLSHYQNVGLKMNYNLQKYIESGLIDYYNLGEENVNMLLSNEDTSIQKFILKIKEKVLLMKEKYDSLNVILDGISHLFDLQYSLRDVNNFCKEIINLTNCYSNSFVLCLCNVASEGDITHVMANLLCHKAYTVVEVQNLASGWSADVSGHLIIKYPGRKFEDEHLNTLATKPNHNHFKLFDRGVKLFASGTVG